MGQLMADEHRQLLVVLQELPRLQDAHLLAKTIEMELEIAMGTTVDP